MFVTDDAERDRTGERSCKKCQDEQIDSHINVTPFDETRFLLCQICLLAEELGNHEGRLGWGEGTR